MSFKLSTPGAIDRFIAEATHIDTAKATVSIDLSHVGFDEETKTFEASCDKIVFKSLGEMIGTVLLANGFKVNLENLLSCLDQLKFGVRARLTARDVEETKPSPKMILPALQFGMPQKARIGEWLGQFYKEISIYEAKITELQNTLAGKNTDKEESPAQLRKEIQRLKAENQDLQERTAELARKLLDAQRSQAHFSRALESQNLLPDNMRLGVVREILWDDRQLTVRSGRKSWQVPFGVVQQLPREDDPCLVYTEDAQVKGFFIYGRQVEPLMNRGAQVLAKHEDAIKLRDDLRREWMIRPANDDERRSFSALTRGEQVLMSFAQDRFIRLQPLQAVAQDWFTDRVQETAAILQVRYEKQLRTRKSKSKAE